MKPSTFTNLVLLASLGACATARVVKSQPGKGGIIAVIPKDSAEARQKAMDIMATNCTPKKPEILEEGEAVVGQSSHSNGNASVVGSFIGTSSTTSSHQETEWQISYKCN